MEKTIIAIEQEFLVQLRRPLEYYQRWRYKNTALLILSVLLVFALARAPITNQALGQLGTYGYLGAFIAGLFSVSVFTIGPAGIILFDIAGNLNPVWIAIVAALGSVLGDYLLLRLLSKSLFDELEPLFSLIGGSLLGAFFRSPYFAWLLPFIGAFIIASPLPDELGVGILGLANLPRWKFLLLAFALNVVGILGIVLAALALK